MAQPRFQRSIRFSEDEWNTVCEAAEQTADGSLPSSFVRLQQALPRGKSTSTTAG